MTAQRGGSAQRDGAHDAAFDAAQVTVMRPSIGIAVAAEDIRHFQTGRHGAIRSGGRHHLQVNRSSGLSVRRIRPFETRV